jgi:hypothetical protein
VESDQVPLSVVSVVFCESALLGAACQFLPLVAIAVSSMNPPRL